MPAELMITVDGNEAVARVAYRLNEVAASYPITPSPVMGGLAADWAGRGQENLWGSAPRLARWHSEGAGAAPTPGPLAAASHSLHWDH